MARTHSITTIFLVTFLASLLLVIALLGYLWFSSSYLEMKHEAAGLKAGFIENQRERLRHQVEQIVQVLEHEKSLAEDRLKENIRNRTQEAYKVASSLFHAYADSHSPEQIAKEIKSVLRSIRYDDGRGYFFATGMDGIEQLFADRPEMEGKDFSGIKDSQGRWVVRDMIDIARTKGEGFYEYTWSKPGHTGSDFRKLSYIKYFPPLDWLIGTGGYPGDTERKIQQEMIARIENIRFGDDGYVFVGDWNGKSLSGPAKGKNMYDLQDVNGVKIVQQLIAQAKKGDGFVNYVMPELDGRRSAPKMSYVMGIPAWQWYLGAGDYEPDIDQKLQESMKWHQQLTSTYLISIVAALTLLLILTYIAFVFLRSRLTASYETFMRFFGRAAHDMEPIDETRLGFTEFRALARAANIMVDKRRLLEEETARLRDLLQSVVDSMPSVLIAVNEESRVVQWNQEAERVTGLSDAEAMGERLGRVFPQLAEQTERIQVALREHKAQQESRIGVDENGQRRYKDITIYPLTSHTFPGAVIRLDDVTERVRLEEMMVQSEKMLSVGGLAAGMAHEINNPLAGILQNIQVLRGRFSPDLEKNRQVAESCDLSMEAMQPYLEAREINRIMDAIMESGARAAKIVDNMLSFSRKSEVGLEEHDLSTLLDDAVELASNDYDLKKKYDFRSVEIIREYAPDTPPVCCEGNQIQQVFLNLLKNGAQAMALGVKGSGPRFYLRIKPGDRTVVVEIEDNGPGLDAATRRRIFEPFYTTKEVGVGTGLGLSISYFIITENHQGSMRVESTPGAGARFIISLPL